jgi:hypothetical protein
MGRSVTQSTDERLNALAGALEPIPAQVAVLDATVTHLAVALGAAAALVASMV